MRKVDITVQYGTEKDEERILLAKILDKQKFCLAKNALKTELAVIRIELPNNLNGEYEHRDYLSVLMRMGMTREKIGDILVFPDGADIVAFAINKEYIIQSLGEFTRFRKARIYDVRIRGY